MGGNHKFIPLGSLLALIAGMGLEAMLGFLGPRIAVAFFSVGLGGWFAALLWTTSRRKRINLIVSASVGLLVIFVVIYIPPILQGPHIDKNRIHLFLQYAYEWDGYKGSKINADISKIIDQPIIKKYSREEIRLLLGVQNSNEPLALKDVLLNVEFINDDLNVRNDPSWGEMIPNKFYFAKIGAINSGVGHHPNGNLWVKFPKPGEYEVSFSIAGEGFGRRDGKFKIILLPG